MLPRTLPLSVSCWVCGLFFFWQIFFPTILCPIESDIDDSIICVIWFTSQQLWNSGVYLFTYSILICHISIFNTVQLRLTYVWAHHSSHTAIRALEYKALAA